MKEYKRKKYMMVHSHSSPTAGVDHLQQVWILQCGSHSFLVIELLVHGSLRVMTSLRQVNVHLEPRGEDTEQLDPDTQTNQRCHAAVLHGWCKCHSVQMKERTMHKQSEVPRMV